MTKDPAPREEEWRKAQQRISLYLRLLNLPPLESLELALQALNQARQTPGEAAPLSKAMHALRQVLRERESVQTRDAESIDLHDMARNPLPAALGRDFCRNILSRPLLNRGFMLPEKVR